MGTTLTAPADLRTSQTWLLGRILDSIAVCLQQRTPASWQVGCT